MNSKGRHLSILLVAGILYADVIDPCHNHADLIVPFFVRISSATYSVLYGFCAIGVNVIIRSPPMDIACQPATV